MNQLPTKEKQGYAKAAMVMGILSIPLFSGCLLVSILAISLALASRDPETRRMSSGAKAGFICGIIGIVMFIVGIAVIISLFFFILNALEQGCAAAGEDISNSLSEGLQNSLSGGFRLPRI